MKTTDDIIFDPKVEWESDGWQSTLPTSEVKKLMIEYAKGVVDEILSLKFEDQLDDLQGSVIFMILPEAVEKIKEELI